MLQLTTLQSSHLLTREQAASHLGISLSTLNNYIKRNIINPIRVGGKVRFEKTALDKLTTTDFLIAKSEQ